MDRRFEGPGLLGAVTRTAIIDGTARVIANALTGTTGRRRPKVGTAPPESVRRDRSGRLALRG